MGDIWRSVRSQNPQFVLYQALTVLAKAPGDYNMDDTKAKRQRYDFPDRLERKNNYTVFSQGGDSDSTYDTGR